MSNENDEIYNEIKRKYHTVWADDCFPILK